MAAGGAPGGAGPLVLRSGAGLEVEVVREGAALRACRIPDRDGAPADVVLGFDTGPEYATRNAPYFGCVVGRVAGRIAGARFRLPDGSEHLVSRNNGAHCLHGGEDGFSRRRWAAETVADAASTGVQFTLTSPDGDQGFPGEVQAAVTYRVARGANRLTVAMEATADRATPISLAQHTYFNLAGHDRGDVLGHKATLYADRYAEVDRDLVPTGALRAVAGTPLDFRAGREIGAGAQRTGLERGGYDHAFCLLPPGADDYVRRPGLGPAMRLAADVHDPGSGRAMQLFSDAAAMVFYTGNFLDGGLAGKGGRAYPQYGGFCLETQDFPNAVNEPAFPTNVVEAGARYANTLVYDFYVK